MPRRKDANDPDYDPVEESFSFERKWKRWKAQQMKGGMEDAKQAWKKTTYEKEWKALYKGKDDVDDAWRKKIHIDSQAAGIF